MSSESRVTTGPNPKATSGETAPEADRLATRVAGHTTREPMSDRKFSMILLAMLLMLIVVCGTIVSCVFRDPQWFTYACGGVFTTLLLIALFGYPF